MSLGSSLGPAYDVMATKETDIKAITEWLKRIEWSPSKAHSLEGVGLARVGRITLNLADGSVQSFGLSGGSIIVGGWEWPVDTDRLAEIARRAEATSASIRDEEPCREEEAVRLLLRCAKARIDGIQPPASWPEKVRRVGSAWVADIDTSRLPGGYPEQIVIDITVTGGHEGNPKR